MIEFISLESFILALREAMEASLIIGIIVATLRKIKANELIPTVWLSTSLALVLSLIVALGMQLLFGGFTGDNEELFEGFVMITAAIILTYMIMWNTSHGSALTQELQEKTNQAFQTGSKIPLFLFVFLMVFREGVELGLFFMGVRAQGTSFNAILVSGFLGILLAILLAWALFKGTVTLNLHSFFLITSIFLLFFSAGLISHGLHELQEIGLFGAETLIWNVPLWDTSFLLSDSKNIVGILLRSLFGYQDQPSLIELFSYFTYLLAGGYYLFRNVSVKKAS